MKNTSNRYSLNIIKRDESVITVVKESLIFIDSITSNFVNKKELLNEINSVFGMKLDLKKTDVEITYNHNQHKKQAKILYKNDRGAMSREKVSEMFLLHTKEIKFIEKFVKRYENNHYLLCLSRDIISGIRNNKEYDSELQLIVNLIFDSYKSTRDVYFFIRNYENNNFKNGKEKPVINVKGDILEALSTLKSVYQPQINLFDFAPEIFGKCDFSNKKVKIKKT
jgi:hypothetical protein